MDNLLRILMIEDSPDDVLITLHILKQNGYSVYSERVDTKEDLLNALKNTWDVILCDYSMPHFNGLEAIQLVRQHDKEIPFIILSGTIKEENAAHFLNNGATDYINKLHLVLLIPAIERVVKEKTIKQENLATKRALEETKERLFHAFHHAGAGVALIDMNSQFMEINESFCSLIGYKNAELMQLKFFDLIDKESQGLFKRVLNPILNKTIPNTQIELHLIHKNKQKLWVNLSLSLVKPSLKDKAPYLIIHFQDRTEQKYFEERLLFLTSYNSLTGLLNRTSFLNKLNELIQYKTPFTLYYLDIDRFKMVNNIYGSHMGDFLLKHIASQLKEHIDSKEILGYLGGNEFMILAPQITNEAEELNRGEVLSNLLQKPIIMQHNELTLTTSIGICHYPNDGKNINELLIASNTALKASKRKGGDCYTKYSNKANSPTNQLLIESELRKALKAHELLIYYQPQISASTNQLSGIEALIRWKKNGTIILPDEFIPIAEESSLILKIGEEILTQACSWFGALQKEKKYHLPPRLSINFSARQFSSPHLTELVKDILSTHKMKPNQIELEITETGLIENIDEVRNTLQQLGELGVRLAIDDFGRGYSSLSYLKDLPINRLKIDKSFVDSCIVDYSSQSIVASIINLAHRLKLEVTAEGVETLEQRQFLNRHQCDEYQGYYFSPPIPPQEIIAFFSDTKQMGVD
jgi:diguanylate cyclase (GGDEF)-like protein/PAS domain S-box-containing protein